MDSKMDERSSPEYYYDEPGFPDSSGDHSPTSPDHHRRRNFLTESEERELSNSTDPKERRRIQNRVAQRAYRQKQKIRLQELEERVRQGRAAAVEAESLRAAAAANQCQFDSYPDSLRVGIEHTWSNLAISYPIATTLHSRVPSVSTSDNDHSTGSTSPISASTPSPNDIFLSSAPTTLHTLAVGYISLTTPDIPTHISPFITIPFLPLNFFITSTLSTLGLTPDAYTSPAARSPFITGHFPLLSAAPVPLAVALSHLQLAQRAPDLLPTPRQCRVEHHPWIDVIPFPGFRERLLSVMESGSGVVDEAVLASDVESSVRVWGRSGGEGGVGRRCWEWSEEFVKKWGWLLDAEAAECTNFWRTQRGEARIEVEIEEGRGERIDEEN